MKEQRSSLDTQSRVILNTAADGKVTADVFFAQDNFWMTQRTTSELFGVNVPAISRHLKNIYASGELNQEATISKMETVQIEGERQIRRKVEVYNLDAVIAVGYRVNSIKATHFRIWATNTLREFIVKGFVLNDQMLKNGRSFGKDYFDELLGPLCQHTCRSKRSEKFEPANGGHIRRLQMCLNSAAAIISEAKAFAVFSYKI